MPHRKASSHVPLSAARGRALGERLRTARVDAGLTQEETAERCGLSVQHIRRLEGGIANPTVGSLYALAEALDASLPDLLPR